MTVCQWCRDPLVYVPKKGWVHPDGNMYVSHMERRPCRGCMRFVGGIRVKGFGCPRCAYRGEIDVVVDDHPAGDVMPPSPDDEIAAVLQFVPHARELMDLLRAKLPEGVHFGLVILVPGNPEGRVLALTTDRRRMARAAGEWIVSVLRDELDERQPGSTKGGGG